MGWCDSPEISFLVDLGWLRIASTFLKRLEALPIFGASFLLSSSLANSHYELELAVHTTSTQAMWKDTHRAAAVSKTIVSCSAMWLSGFQLREEGVPRTCVRSRSRRI